MFLLQDCMMDEDCTVATYVSAQDRPDMCTLKKCPLHANPVDAEGSQSYKFCTGMHLLLFNLCTI